MVQNIDNQNNKYVSINKIATSNEGRAIYELKEANGNIVGKLSIPQVDCDRFEKAYNDIISSAPQLEEYMKNNSSPAAMKKMKKKTNWLVFGFAGIGALIPAIRIKTADDFVKIISTIAGGIAGLAVGIGLNNAFLIPPGMRKMNKATKEISKIDIKPA